MMAFSLILGIGLPIGSAVFQEQAHGHPQMHCLNGGYAPIKGNFRTRQN